MIEVVVLLTNTFLWNVIEDKIRVSLLNPLEKVKCSLTSHVKAHMFLESLCGLHIEQLKRVSDFPKFVWQRSPRKSLRKGQINSSMCGCTSNCSRRVEVCHSGYSKMQANLSRT